MIPFRMAAYFGRSPGCRRHKRFPAPSQAGRGNAGSLAVRVVSKRFEKLLDRKASGLGKRAAAYELHDFDFIAFAEPGLRPQGAPDDFAIDFDGQSPRRQFQQRDQVSDRQTLCDMARFSVDRDEQNVLLSAEKIQPLL